MVDAVGIVHDGDEPPLAIPAVRMVLAGERALSLGAVAIKRIALLSAFANAT